MPEPLPNPPVGLILAIDEEPELDSLLGRLLRHLADLGLRRFIVVCPPGLKQQVETIATGAGVPCIVAPLGEENSVPAALVAAEPALSHIAAGPVYITRPRDAAAPRLHDQMLASWLSRPSNVDGLIAARSSSDNGGAVLETEGERVTEVTDTAGAETAAASLVAAGPLIYAQVRELCETVGDERDKFGAAGALERGLSRLAYWYQLRYLLTDAG